MDFTKIFSKVPLKVIIRIAERLHNAHMPAIKDIFHSCQSELLLGSYHSICLSSSPPTSLHSFVSTANLNVFDGIPSFVALIKSLSPLILVAFNLALSSSYHVCNLCILHQIQRESILLGLLSFYVEK